MFFKRSKTTASEPVATQADAPSDPSPKRWLSRVKQGLTRTRRQLTAGLATLLSSAKTIDDELLEDLEAQLIMADVGVETSQGLMAQLTRDIERKTLAHGDALFAAVRQYLTQLLRAAEQPLTIATQTNPFVILVVGVNGVGKTTTVGKLAKHYQTQGKKVMLAAGDTFRAAAVEQLQVWGQRNQVPVVAQQTGADSASVIYDALQSAQAKGMDLLIADTAGRLHNKDNLMDELAKVKRVMAKLDVQAPHEVLLVLDAGTGQNALNQAQQFQRAVGVSGLALTKLDGTAKGGVIFALSDRLGLPVRFIGVGEGIDDLQPFSAEPFVDALFGESSPKD